jgi:hypothetical protein
MAACADTVATRQKSEDHAYRCLLPPDWTGARAA